MRLMTMMTQMTVLCGDTAILDLVPRFESCRGCLVSGDNA